MNTIFKVTAFVLHSLNIFARSMEDPVQRQARRTAIAAAMAEEYYADSRIGYVLVKGVPHIVRGGTRLDSLNVLLKAGKTVRFCGQNIPVADYEPPQDCLGVDLSDAEVAALVNQGNMVDSGGKTGQKHHPLVARLTLALKVLPRVDFVAQGKYSMAQLRVAAGIRDGSERELSACLLTLASFIGCTEICAKADTGRNEDRHFLGGHENVTAGKKDGLIPALEKALKTGNVAEVQRLSGIAKTIIIEGWEAIDARQKAKDVQGPSG